MVVKNRALGDAIIGLGSLQYLRQLFPDAKLFYSIPEWTTPLFHNEPNLQIIPLKLDSLSAWWSYYLNLKKLGPFDLIIELNQNGRTGKFFKFFSFTQNVPYGYHNHHRKDKTIILDQGMTKANLQRDLDGVYSVLKHYNFLKDSRVPNYLDFTPQMQVEATSKKNKIILGLVATRETKMWPVDHYIKLIDLIDKQYEFIIPLSNSELDQKIENKLKSFPPKSNVSILKIPLKDLPKHFSEAKLYIGNDTGIKHLAIALNIPTISFFGPEEPLEWHPYDIKKHPYFFIEKLTCRTQISHYCPLNTCDSMICLNDISPEKVFVEVEKILQK